jgi:hypothetical protein
MLTTDVIMHINMGFLDGATEHKMDEKEVQTNYAELKQHLCDILPEPDVLGLEDKIQQIEFKSLEIGKWTSCHYGTYASLTPNPPVSYNLQLTVSIQHEKCLSFDTVAEVINGIHDNGASFPITFEEYPNYVLYPFHSSVSDMDDGICVGH